MEPDKQDNEQVCTEGPRSRVADGAGSWREAIVALGDGCFGGGQDSLLGAYAERVDQQGGGEQRPAVPRTNIWLSSA